MNHVQTLPVSEAKQRLTVLVKGSEEMYDKYLITRNGKSSAMLMSADEYAGLMETLDILSNRKEVIALGEARKQARTRKTISLASYLTGNGRHAKKSRRK